MKQCLGDKKHRKCERIAGRLYRACYANGSQGPRTVHGVAECWFGRGDADYVNWRTSQVWPYLRDGRPAEPFSDPQPDGDPPVIQPEIIGVIS